MSGSNIPSVELYPEVVVFTVFIITYTCGSALAAGFTHLLFRLNGKQVVCEFLLPLPFPFRCFRPCAVIDRSYCSTDVSLMSLSVFLQNMLTVAQESFSLSMWPSLQVAAYEENLKQWRNPKASTVYQTLPDLSIKIIFNISIPPKSTPRETKAYTCNDRNILLQC